MCYDRDGGEGDGDGDDGDGDGDGDGKYVCNVPCTHRHHLRVEMGVAEGQAAHESTGVVYRNHLHHCG